MIFKLDQTPPHQVYNLLIGLVFPRPIALVTTHDLQGKVNAAPFSSYNYLSTDPPVLGLGVASMPGRENFQKTTLKNILNTKEFVVNVVTEDIAQKMNICAIDFPHDINKLEIAEIKAEPSSIVSVPRIEGIHAALECKHISTLQIGRSHIVLGQVVSIFVEEEFVDKTSSYIMSENIKNIGRANGLGAYVKTSGSFIKLPRLTYEDWKKTKSSSPTTS